MPEYMCLLYATPSDVDRSTDMPRWVEVTEKLRAAGVLRANARLRPVDTATTLRIRDGDLRLTDGPFATTKETLAGYYLLECADLDEALQYVELLPIAEYGSVEIRPLGFDPGPGSLDDEESPLPEV
jgi:hypothetical protein